MTVASPWDFNGQIAPVGGAAGTITLVDETTFCLSGPDGDVRPGGPHGLLLLDTRFVSGLCLRVNGMPVEPLGVSVDDPFHATFYGRISPRRTPDSPLVVARRRAIGRGLVDRISVENHGLDAVDVQIVVEVETDFADLFEVKEQRPTTSRVTQLDAGDGELRMRGEREGVLRGTRIRGEGALAALHGGAGVLTWATTLEPQAVVDVCVEVEAQVAGEWVEPRHTCRGDDGRSASGRRLGAWRARVPHVRTDDERLLAAVQRGAEDIGALQIIDPDHPDEPVVAAGAPWFMTLFGRDALLTSYMSLLVDPELAHGVVRTLARLQGRVVDPDTEEEPGRILHELRFTDRPSWRFADGRRYYGSVDATPLFVMMLGEIDRWGLDDGEVEDLLPAADAALAWMAEVGDRDGDGYLEYQRATPLGLANQGWKDSWDAIRFADGRLARGPIALCEVQGYAYAAYLARAHLARDQGDVDRRDALLARAASLREAFHRDFWLDDRGHLALALDGDKRPVDALASNMGHCLWTGILDPEPARLVADRLLSPELFSGWGVRTLATSMAAYNPISYHNGSVWPHDNAVIAAGLVRYGFVEHAHRVIDAMLDVSTHHDGRLPELIAGTERAQLAVPATYPTSCIPQAWASAAPLLFLRSLLRLDPSLPWGEVRVAPALLDGMDELRVEGVPIGGGRVTIDVRDGTTEVSGLPPGVALHRHARPPIVPAPMLPGDRDPAGPDGGLG